MSQRKKYLIDKKIQLGMTFSILGAVLIVSAVIILSIASGVVYNNNKIEDVLKVQDHIINFLDSRISVDENEDYKKTLQNISQNHANNIVTLKGILDTNKLLLIAIIVFIIVQCFVLYIISIKRTHRISGPIYVMTNYIKDILEGRLPPDRSLRKKDELKDFFELVKKLAERSAGLKK